MGSFHTAPPFFPHYTIKMLDCVPPWSQSLPDHSGISLQTQTANSITIFFSFEGTFEITRPPGCWLTCVHHLRLNALARHKRSQFTQERTSAVWDLPTAPNDARRAAHSVVCLPSPLRSIILQLSTEVASLWAITKHRGPGCLSD